MFLKGDVIASPIGSRGPCYFLSPSPIFHRWCGCCPCPLVNLRHGTPESPKIAMFSRTCARMQGYRVEGNALRKNNSFSPIEILTPLREDKQNLSPKNRFSLCVFIFYNKQVYFDRPSDGRYLDIRIFSYDLQRVLPMLQKND